MRNKLRITEQRLRNIIREAIRGHIDGHPFPGSLEDLAKFHGKFWAHGDVVDSTGWKESIKTAQRYTRGTAPGPLKTKQRNINERRSRTTLKKRLEEIIRKLSNGKYRLYSKKKNPKTGERRNLGTFDSREAAKQHERQVQYFKHGGK